MSVRWRKRSRVGTPAAAPSSGWIKFSPRIIFVKREYLERQAKAEAFKAGEEIDGAIESVQNAGEKLKATAEEAKNSLEAKTGSNNGDAGLLPSIWMLVLLPRMMV